MSCRSLCSSFVMLFLLVVCTVLFVLHSLYFILRYAEQSRQEDVSMVDEMQQYIPSIVVCNRMTFSQDGIGVVSGNLRQEQVIRYLREWTNPRMRESADYFPPASDSYTQQGIQMTSQYLPQSTRKQQIQSMMYQCQSIINSCTFKGLTMTSYQCCLNVQTFIPTLGGICMVYQDKTLWQNSTGPGQQFVITFQMSRNSFQGNGITTHPGVDVYLRESVNPIPNDIIRLAHELDTPITLADKEGVRLKMHKERKADIRRGECGMTVDGSRKEDEQAASNNKSGLLLCLLQTSINVCGCHPLIAELLPIHSQQFWTLSQQVNTTAACTVPQYDNCARGFVSFAEPKKWEEPIPIMNGSDAIKQCRREYHRSCLMTSYPGILDRYTLPPEYLSNTDYISRLTLEYDTMKVTEVLTAKNPSLYEMLSFIGYNVALWFAVGHILWTLFATSRDAMCGNRNNKVEPLLTRPPPPVVNVEENVPSPTHSNRLPPISPKEEGEDPAAAD